MSTTSFIFQVLGPMVNTFISVSPGDILRFSCVGFIDQGWIPWHRIVVDADGFMVDGSYANESMATSAYPLLNGIRYALIGQIVTPAGVIIRKFHIGKQAKIVIGESGILQLGANDDLPDDNKSVADLQSPWRVSVDHTVKEPPPPKFTPGLRIEDIQIHQVASNWGSNVLIANKTTAIRAFLSLQEPLLPGMGVDGYVEVSGTRENAINPYPGPTTDTVKVPLPGMTIDINDTNASLNFEVAGVWLPISDNISHYTFKVTVFVGNGNLGDGFSSSDQRTVGFSKNEPILIYLLMINTPIGTGRFGTPTSPVPFLSNLSMEDVEASLPVADGGVVLGRTLPAAITFEIDAGGDGNGYDEIAIRINFLRFSKGIRPLLFDDGVVMGVIAPGHTKVGGHTDGQTMLINLRNAKDALYNTAPNSVTAHELGHTYGLKHAGGPCGTPSDIDKSLPQEANSPGWSTLLHGVIPTGTPAIMGYCRDAWPTGVELVRIYQNIIEKAKP